jgi:hypothetical protein
MRVAVSGTRRTSEKDIRYIWTVFDFLHDKYEIDTILHGGATGVDALADEWADENDISVERYEALWQKYGRSAGPQRNAAMLASDVEFWIAFPRSDSTGTNDFIEKARKAGIPGEVYPII